MLMLKDIAIWGKDGIQKRDVLALYYVIVPLRRLYRTKTQYGHIVNKPSFAHAMLSESLLTSHVLTTTYVLITTYLQLTRFSLQTCHNIDHRSSLKPERKGKRMTLMRLCAW